MFNPLLVLPLSELLLSTLNLRMFVEHRDRIPQDATVMVVSNHRSFMDALILIKALEKPLRIACHHYMGEMPMLRELVTTLGCFPLAEPPQRSRMFLQQGGEFLESRQWLGIFPEGAQPMVNLTLPNQVGQFETGFAHLVFKARIDNLVVLPVAIASQRESVHKVLPLKFLQFFDPSEPLFTDSGLHPVVVYERVDVLIGHPYWITALHQAKYRGEQRKRLAYDLRDYCRQEIITMLKEHRF
ncbi:1-acyl-sn-glycerol-3-phosphate acyltransferase [Gloeocapsa sp. PCC 73106]|uniref:lysophospholipid acyltransferase family protein n=1 Tax=Gloeocapsa sp. PCC 73106 TaxID=102232 RepID=UPI0002AC0029|nr:lysophospholipid acyltransferase family protein [Gloeocapsa sp. PCC 73106]ELR99302.1 1-acyl-sn-glycerol-3-phosphate acyltransferase [Gloeocapsa sp. PCC 73106]